MSELRSEPSAQCELRLEDPAFYDDGQYAVYERLQREDPVYHYAPLDLYVLSRYDDVRRVSRSPEIFSSTGGLTLNELRLRESGVGHALDAFFDPSGELMITLDPPRHRALKQTLTPAFTPRSVGSMGPRIAELVACLLDPIVAGRPVEVVSALAARLPVLVAAEVLGVRGPDVDRIQVWTEALEDLTKAETEADLLDAARRFAPVQDFLREQVALTRKAPGNDVMTTLLGATIDGAPLTEAHILTHLMTLLSNSGTTRLLVASLLGLLADHPDQLELLVEQPELRASAIEEALRVAPPARGFVRTATRDVELHGRTIRAGQQVYLLYTAANRDPNVFSDPHRFDISRHQERLHVSFGYGTHTCLGAALVRREADVFLTELLARHRRIGRAGTPVRQEHVQLNGWSRLELVFS